jgi:hypothetical protein
MSLKVISLKETTKNRFEQLQRFLSLAKKADLSQDEVLEALLDAYVEYKEVDI